VADNIITDYSGNDNIYIDPVTDGKSDNDGKLLVIKNIESILLYHNCEKQTILTNSGTAKELKTHLSNVTWE
jgi:hypothetical protein